MKNAMQKDFWREIGHTRSRFFSIMILVALSVAFLSGLKATAPDMKHTGDDYLDSLHLADIQVLSTLGLTDEDIAALRAQDKIEDAEGEYVIDAFASSDSLDAVVKVLSLTDRGISDVLLREGRMPERADECVVEENMLSLMSISIGDTITLTPGDDLSDALAQDTYTVVGTVRSPVYLAVERGTSTLGSGTVKAYLYLPREAFTLDYYTAAYVRVSDAAEMTAFYDEYDDYIDDVIDSLEDFGERRASLRHDELVDEATEKLDDAQKELDDAKAEADEKLGDARKELADARRKLDDGWKEYDDGKQELADSRVKLDDAKAELEDGEQEYADGVKKYDQAVRDYEKGQKDYADGVKDYEKGAQQLADGADELEAGKEKLDEGQKQLDALGNTVAGALQNDPNYAGVTGGTIIDELGRGDENTAAATDAALDKMRAQLEGGIAQAQQGLAKIDAGIEQCDEGLARIDAALAKLGEDQSELAAAKRAVLEQQRADTAAQRSDLVQQRGKVSAQLSELQSQLAALSTVSSGSIAANKQQLDQGRADYESGKQQLSAGYRDLRDGKKELDKAKKELDEAPQKLADARKELDDARKELDDGWKEYYDGEEKYADGEKELADAYRELTDGEKDYREGLREYEDGKAEADEKIADAEEKIADARRKVADIESCEWYLFSRSYNPGYTGYGQDAERMANLASVFPVIFFLVAALVCLTTMTRMVEEQRVQIGSLKAMGYSGLAISRKYLLYGLLPSLTGGVFGLVIGYILFPKMIFTAYQIMYQMPNIELRAYGGISAYSLLAAVACTTLATLWACLATLRETPASLMRPRTPKAGKRVFLEYIKPLWRKMSFTHKVTARNLFRYQKRFWMTVIGIGGCTALIIAGFGMRSSLLFTMSRQYDDLFHYSAQVTLSSNVLPEERQAVEDFLAGDSRVVNDVPCTASSATVITSSYSTTAYVEVMEADEIGKVIDLLDCKTGEPITMEDTGVYIDQKLSELLKVSVGDTFFLDGDARGDVTVAGIYEHYTGHFIYMTPSYYEQTLHADSEPNAYLMNFTSDDTDTCNAIFEKLLSMNGVVTTSRMRDTQDTYMHSMERVDFVVVIIILAAAALAMVVLFNLSNINITERQRELATIKLLGFYDKEVSAYVYRENIVLTVFGILMGCFMGHWLHIYLVRSTEIDLMMFGRQTAPSAYVYAAILTMLFSVLVNVLAHFKMKKIDMVESLKSAE
ncbi:MAG: FtsX-like permease family protein [Oscillospiraceae bacterium]|nr:FtsX-like permease family protein [Oscillospiraceae bacterium]